MIWKLPILDLPEPSESLSRLLLMKSKLSGTEHQKFFSDKNNTVLESIFGLSDASSLNSLRKNHFSPVTHKSIKSSKSSNSTAHQLQSNGKTFKSFLTSNQLSLNSSQLNQRHISRTLTQLHWIYSWNWSLLIQSREFQWKKLWNIHISMTLPKATTKSTSDEKKLINSMINIWLIFWIFHVN